MRALFLAVAFLWTVGCSSSGVPLEEHRRAGTSSGDCGRTIGALPDFTLVDANETSPTSGAEVTLSAFAGQVVVIYWAHAT